MKRRDFLVGAGLAGLALHAPAFAAAPGPADSLLGLLDDRKTAAALGAAWLQEGSQQPSAVLAALRSRLQKCGWTDDADVDHRRDIFDAAVTDDYRTGTMIAIEGWQIATAEAELCALAYFAETGVL